MKVIAVSQKSKILLIATLVVVLLLVGGCYARRLLYGVAQGVTVEGYEVGRYLPEEVRQLVTHLAIERNRPAIDPRLANDGNIIQETPGLAVDVEQSIIGILEAPKDATVPLIIRRLQPDITASLLKSLDTTLGKFNTFISGSENRLKNITIAAGKLNYTLVNPRTLFSINEAIGPRTTVQGYKPAPVIIGEGHGLDAGGGVCQVSSTLYNAVMTANLKIVERHPHSKRVYYVPPGKDAAISWPGLDFKFYNSLNNPVIIRTSVAGRVLTIWLLGKKDQESKKGGE